MITHAARLRAASSRSPPTCLQHSIECLRNSRAPICAFFAPFSLLARRQAGSTSITPSSTYGKAKAKKRSTGTRLNERWKALRDRSTSKFGDGSDANAQDVPSALSNSEGFQAAPVSVISASDGSQAKKITVDISRASKSQAATKSKRRTEPRKGKERSSSVTRTMKSARRKRITAARAAPNQARSTSPVRRVAWADPRVVKALDTDRYAHFGRLNRVLGLKTIGHTRSNGSHITASVTSTTASDLVNKLKLAAQAQGRLMTKQVLVELLETDALTKPARRMLMQKLRHSLLSIPPQNIEHIVADAAARAPGVGVSPDSILPGLASSSQSMTLKQAMQAARTDVARSASKSKTPRGTSGATNNIKEAMSSNRYTNTEVQSVSSAELVLTPLDIPQPPVPTLAYGLERALFNPGVFHLRDPHSRVFNFDPYLQTIMPVADFDFSALKEYVTSSKDSALVGHARRLKSKYTGSTSSMTSMLAHFHYVLSQWREITVDNLSKGFPVDLKSFSAIQRAPAAIFLRYKDGVYAIDADKRYDTPNILSMLGKSMEKLLTLPTEQYERYHRNRSSEITADERDEKEAFHYTTMGDFLMRSQLDAYDPRLPGTGMFDLKTRAVVSIRMDVAHYEKGVGYEIRGRHGDFHSYEREYFDMIRSAFLKYSLQVRMGRMDGIYVAFHSTERIFGFQYISLGEMDYAVHGTDDTYLGDQEFKLSLGLLNKVLDRATAKFPKQSLQLHFEARESDKTPFLYIFATPISDKDINAIQNTGREAVLKFEKEVLGLHGDDAKKTTQQESQADPSADVVEQASTTDAEWEALQAQVEDQIEEDEVFDIERSHNEAEAVEEHTLSENELQAAEAETDRRLAELLEAGETDVVSPTTDDVDASKEEQGDVEMTTPDSDREREIQMSGTSTSNTSMNAGDASANASDTSANIEALPPISNHDPTSEDTQTIMAETASDDRKAPDSPQKSISPSSPSKTKTPARTLHLGPSSPGYPKSDSEILAMYLTIRNKINGSYALRPERLSEGDDWTVEYALADIPTTHRGRTLYDAMLKRRAKVLSNGVEEKVSEFRKRYLNELYAYVREGKKFRREEQARDEREEIRVFEGKSYLIKDESGDAAAKAETVSRQASSGREQAGGESGKEKAQEKVQEKENENDKDDNNQKEK